MTLLRLLTWAVVLGATAFAGPNLPSQGLQAARVVADALARRCFDRFIA
jgi:hypothetical protein